MPDHHRHHHHYHLHEYPDPEYIYNPQHDYYGPDPGPGYPEVAQEPANALPKERGLAKDHRPAPLDVDSHDADYNPRDKYYLPNDEDQPRFEPSLASEPPKSRSRRRSSTHNHHHDDDRRHSRHRTFSPDHHYDSASRRGRSPPPLSRLSGGPFPYREGSRSSSLVAEDPGSTTITPTGRGRGASTASAARRSSVSRPAALRDVELAATAAAAAAAASAASDRRSRRGSARDVADVDRAATASPRRTYYPPSASRAKSVANRSSAPSRRLADDGDEDRDHDNDRGHDRRPRGPRRRSSSTTSVDTRRRAEPPPSSASRSRSVAEGPRGRGSGDGRRRRGSVDGIMASLRAHEDMFMSMAKCAAEAGAVAAVKMRHDNSPWIGAKGTKVAAAAIGGGMVDAMVGQDMAKGVRKGGIRHAVLKQAATMALGSMVFKPAARGTRFERGA